MVLVMQSEKCGVKIYPTLVLQGIIEILTLYRSIAIALNRIIKRCKYRSDFEVVD